MSDERSWLSIHYVYVIRQSLSGLMRGGLCSKFSLSVPGGDARWVGSAFIDVSTGFLCVRSFWELAKGVKGIYFLVHLVLWAGGTFFVQEVSV